MSLFKDILGADESLFKNPVALDFEYVPKLVPYREDEQREIAYCIRPLLNNMNGKNLLIYGRPGVGKTVAIKHILNELEEETNKVFPIYINCWQKNTTFKIMVELCEQIGYKFTHNKNTEELLGVVKRFLNKQSAVFAFDEIDKVEDFDFLYYLLEGIYRKTVLAITNYKDWVAKLDERVRSRLTLQLLEFPQYNADETKGILLKRLDAAFMPEVWEDEAFLIVARKTAEVKDIRVGLHLLKEAGNIAEAEAKRKVLPKHVTKAISGLDEFTIKDSEALDDEELTILELAKELSGQKIGELFEEYKQRGGQGVYKTFQRKIDKLSKNGFLNVEKLKGGAQGTTTIVHYKSKEKKLTEF
jgi:archaeal cell division control protein 6